MYFKGAIELLYNQGTATFVEDGWVANLPFFSVEDAVSGLYDPKMGPTLFDGRTGGQKVVDIVEETIRSATPDDPLMPIIEQANRKVGLFCQKNGLSMSEVETLPGIAIAIARIGTTHIDIVQAADCMAIIKLHNGHYAVTANQVYAHDKAIRAHIQDMVTQNDGDRGAGFAAAIPMITQLRRQHCNQQNGYALLNGQGRFLKCIQTLSIPLDSIEALLLFSDGFVPFDATKDPVILAAGLFKEIENGNGLQGILDQTRDAGREEKNSHIQHPEAMAIYLGF